MLLMYHNSTSKQLFFDKQNADINNEKINRTQWFEWPYKRHKIKKKDYTGWDIRMWPLAVLTWWPH